MVGPARRVAGPRTGHSLPELVVAVTFLAASLVAVGSSAVLGARWTGQAASRQQAARLAAAVLDSLAALPEPGTGQRSAGGLVARWEDGPLGIRVVVSAGTDGPVLAELDGARVPAVPVLADPVAADTAVVPVPGRVP